MRLPCSFVLTFATSATAQSIVFTEVAAQKGLIWSHTESLAGMGAGAGLFDADGDGDLDALLVGGKAAPGLFRNNGALAFTDITAGSSILPPTVFQTHMGVACADIDSDSDVDAFVTGIGPNALYRNHGNATFANTTIAAGLQGAFSSSWGSSAAFGDYDRDGDLDLYLCNYVTVPSQPTPNRLYRNQGNGTFVDVTTAANVAGNGTALACQWSDHDDDGDVDLWVGNDLGMFFEPIRLYRNDGAGAAGNDWIFTDVAPALGANLAIYCMGLHTGDIDRDGDFDLHFSNIGAKRLLRYDGLAGYVDIAAAAGVALPFDPYQPGGVTASWGQGFHDFDRDGWLDLYVAHGFVPPPIVVDPNSANVENAVDQLWRYDSASGSFANVSAGSGIEDPEKGRGAAFGDLDQDGDVDIVQANVLGPARLYRNDTVSANRWLRVIPRGRLSARDALGAKLRAKTADGWQVRETLRNYGYLSSHDPAVHFGLGPANEVDELELRWPRGLVQRRYRVPTNQHLAIKEPYLVFDSTSSFTPVAAEGNSLLLTPVLRNATANPLTAWFFLELRVGAVTWMGPVFSLPVGGEATVSVPLAIPVPVRATGGAPIPIEIVWNLYDATVGHDQWRNLVTITP
jgi:enediyne biosynthesis protein E4